VKEVEVAAPPVVPEKERKSPSPELKPLPRLDDLRSKARHATSGSDTNIFLVHPGTKVDIPTGKYIPSVILDGRLAPRDGFVRRDSYGN